MYELQRINDELDARGLAIDEQATLASLAKMSPATYGKKRQSLAEELGIPVNLLDKEWRERRKADSRDTAPMFEDVEPWPQPVDGSSLLAAMTARFKRHVVFSDHAAHTAALWVAFAWTHDAHVHSPLLSVTSPEANSGKTTLLGVLRFLAFRALPIVEISPAVLYRIMERWRPTLIVDEADDIFNDNAELRSVINSGWTRGTGVPRCNPETFEPELFNTFGPKAIGAKGKKLPDTTQTRAIVIEMLRKRAGDKVDDFEHVDDDEFRTLRSMLARWSADNLKKLERAKPPMPEGFQNRLAANWRPLLAIADLAGCEWPKLAREAALALSKDETESLGTMLLRDIGAAFEGTDRITSAELCQRLHELEDRPWAEFGRSRKPISPSQLARLLKGFRVAPETIRIGTATAKGYMLGKFDDPFQRYLGGSEPSQRNNADEHWASGQNGAVTKNHDVTAVKAHKSANGKVCYGVPAEKPACAHCGKHDEAIQAASYDGREIHLHADCIEPFIESQVLSIPGFLQRSAVQ